MMISNNKKRFKRISTIIITFILLYVISLFATKMIYDTIFERYDGSGKTVPQELLKMVEQREQKEYASDDNRLCGYLYRSTAQDAHEGLVVMAPGLNAGADDYLWQIQSLLDYGWSVFSFDATGSCQSEGEDAVGFPQIYLDLEATIQYLEENQFFGYEELILFGHSRGGYAACCMLGEGYDISAVISVSGVNSAMEGVIGSADKYVGPLAYGNYGNLWMYQTMLFGSDIVGMNADEKISAQEVPVLIVHGRNDEEVPPDRYSIISHKEEIESEQVEYLWCTQPGQDGHTSLLFEPDGTANEKLMKEIDDFLTRKLQYGHRFDTGLRA